MWLPAQMPIPQPYEITITVLLDREDMQNLYNQWVMIQEIQKQEIFV